MVEERFPIRLFIVSEQALFRELLGVVLEADADFTVVGVAANALTCTREVDRTRPDVLVMDIGSPPDAGTTGVSRVKLRFPGCRILAIAHDPDVTVLIDSLEAGASGFLGRDCPISDLMMVIRTIHEGQAHVPPHMLMPLLEQLFRQNRQREEGLHQLSQLTNREQEVIVLLADGRDNEAIAKTLLISPQTARTHVQNILTKLDVHSRLEAAALLARSGMLRRLSGAPAEKFVGGSTWGNSADGVEEQLVEEYA